MCNCKKVESYVSPEVNWIVMDSEGVLCGSASHDSFVEDDSWGDLLEEDE